jgi:hypothetical protein
VYCLVPLQLSGCTCFRLPLGKHRIGVLRFLRLLSSLILEPPFFSMRLSLSSASGCRSGSRSCYVDPTRCLIYRLSYLIIIKSLMPSVVAALYHDLTSADTNPPAWALSGRIWISLIMIMLAPLGFLRRLDSLRHTSYVALFSVGMVARRPLIDYGLKNLHSVPDGCRRLLLLPSFERHSHSWGDTSHSFHAEFCVDFSRTNLCFHLCTER